MYPKYLEMVWLIFIERLNKAEVIDFKVVEDHGNLGDMSDEEMAFHHMGLNASGILTLLSFIGSIALFAEVSIRVWDFPTTGSYLLSLFFVGSFWWTGALIQPRNN